MCVSHRAPAGSSHSPALHCQSPSSGQRRRGGGDRDGRCGETPLRARLHSGASLPVCLEGTGGPRCAAHVTDVWARVREAQGKATAWEPLTKGFCSQQPCKRAHLDVKEDHSARTACGDLRLDDGVSLYASRVRVRVAFLCQPSLANCPSTELCALVKRREGTASCVLQLSVCESRTPELQLSGREEQNRKMGRRPKTTASAQRQLPVTTSRPSPRLDVPTDRPVRIYAGAC